MTANRGVVPTEQGEGLPTEREIASSHGPITRRDG
jgi:hypothetical protein